MFGQLPDRGAPLGGAVRVGIGVVRVGVPLVVPDDEPLVAAFAMAAPPPATAPVATSVASANLIRCMLLTSFRCRQSSANSSRSPEPSLGID